MPELPEAETIARGLRAFVVGRSIHDVTVHHADLLDLPPEGFTRALIGDAHPPFESTAPSRMAIADVTRRGKNVVLPLVPEEEASQDPRPLLPIPSSPLTLVINLGMSGRLLWRSADDTSPPPTHPAVTFHLGEDALIYHDPRRFGRIQLLSQEALHAWSGALGPEPLDPAFTPAHLTEALACSRAPIRSWLLDQRRIAGVGNIYASEACHVAGIHPLTPASRIGETAAERLHTALREVLERAVARGGTTLRDYRTAQGWEGSFQHDLKAYGQAGRPCATCTTPIERIVFSNRSAFLCPRCQPAPEEATPQNP